jgi:hypothetical protein
MSLGLAKNVAASCLYAPHYDSGSGISFPERIASMLRVVALFSVLYPFFSGIYSSVISFFSVFHCSSAVPHLLVRCWFDPLELLEQ